MICRSPVDVARGPQNFVACGFTCRESELAAAACIDAGGKALRRTLRRNIEDRLAHDLPPVRETLAFIDRIGRPGRHAAFAPTPNVGHITAASICRESLRRA